MPDDRDGPTGPVGSTEPTEPNAAAVSERPTGPDGADAFAHRAVLRFPYPTERRARTVHGAVGVEVGAIDDDRSAATATRDGDAVEVTVRAADLVALRAGVNTWTRLVATAETVAATAARE